MYLKILEKRTDNGFTNEQAVEFIYLLKWVMMFLVYLKQI